MGDPIEPTPADRAETRETARKVLEAVRADESVAKAAGLYAIRNVANNLDFYDSDDVDSLLTALALEIDLLSREKAEIGAARERLEAELTSARRWCLGIEATLAEIRRQRDALARPDGEEF